MNTVTLTLNEYLKMRDDLKDLKELINNPDDYIVWAEYSPPYRYHVKKTESSSFLFNEITKREKVIAELRKELSNQAVPEIKPKPNFFKKLFKIK